MPERTEHWLAPGQPEHGPLSSDPEMRSRVRRRGPDPVLGTPSAALVAPASLWEWKLWADRFTRETRRPAA